ncbi:UNVERIFIED_ORG: hypothetical protein J2W19_001184 [Shinella zoogloeoides]|nr:hypothetical protein [Shinella zoogloeoides]
MNQFRLGLRQSHIGRNLDLARFHRFRDFALEVDGQQTIDEASAHDLDIIGKLKSALERPAGDATVQILDVFSVRLLARYGEQ